MPWEVKRFPDGFYVVNQETNEKKNKNPYHTKADAMKYLRALYANAGSEAMRNK